MTDAEASPQLLRGRRGAVVGVSGASSIGFHCAKHLVAMGAEVAVTHRPARAATAGPLAASAGCALALALDIDDEQTVADAFARLDATWGRLDFLVHTLVHVPEGILSKPLVDVTREELGRVIDVGAHSLVLLARYATPLLTRSESPRIVSLTSACGQRMTPSYHAAGIAKAALGAVVLYLAYELGPRGILVNAVSPSLIATDGAVRAVGEKNAEVTRALLAKRAPTRRAADLDDVAGCVAWLVSSLARNVTGETISVDGGYARSYF